MALPMTCSVCGDPFVAQRASAKYCSATCRQRARRRTQAPAPPTSEDAETDTAGIVRLTRDELTRLGKVETVNGQQALNIATRLTSGKETGSAAAALSRELSRLMALATVGAAAADPVDEVQKRRDAKRAAARKTAS